MTPAISSNAGAVARFFAEAAAQLADDIDTAQAEALDALIDEMLPVTPVRSGNMRADYSRRVANGHGELLDEQLYSLWVAYTGTRRMAPNPDLQRILDHAGDVVEARMADVLARRLGGTP